MCDCNWFDTFLNLPVAQHSRNHEEYRVLSTLQLFWLIALHLILEDVGILQRICLGSRIVCGSGVRIGCLSTQNPQRHCAGDILDDASLLPASPRILSGRILK